MSFVLKNKGVSYHSLDIPSSSTTRLSFNRRSNKKKHEITRLKRQKHNAKKTRKKSGMRVGVLSTDRVNKVTKGGKQRSLRVSVAVGDGTGRIGLGIGSAKRFGSARLRAIRNGRRRMIRFPLTSNRSIPHEIKGKFGAAEILLRPLSPGRGLKAGRTAYTILTLGGIKNGMAKQLGSMSRINNARALLVALKNLKR